MRIIAIDPGPTESAYADYESTVDVPAAFAKVSNTEMLHVVTYASEPEAIAIEMVASYGMAVGREVFETCLWIGRFMERWLLRHQTDPILVYRREVKLHLCADSRAKDANIRQALIDRYGPGKEAAIGRKASPGPLYGLTGDCWSALAVAVTCAETRLVGAAA